MDKMRFVLKSPTRTKVVRSHKATSVEMMITRIVRPRSMTTPKNFVVERVIMKLVVRKKRF
jgi:hypothetical protein